MSELVGKIITELRTTFPGIVEEWERQRADGNEDWPTYDTPQGLRWWLFSEYDLTRDFSRDDDTGVEQKLGAYCLEAAQRLQGKL